MVWRRDFIEQEKVNVKTALSECAGNKSEFAAAQLFSINSDGDERSQMRRFIFACQLLRYHVIDANTKLSKSEIDNIVTLAGHILRSNGIFPQTGRMSFLFEELFLIVSQIRFHQGDSWGSLWAQQRSELMSESADKELKATQLIARAIRLFRLGYAGRAIPLFQQAVTTSSELRRQSHARLLEARCHRFVGEFQRARELIDSLQVECEVLGDIWKTDLQWELASLKLFEEHNSDSFASLLSDKSNSKHWQPEYLGEWALLRYALDTKGLLKIGLMPTTLIKKSVVTQKANRQLYGCLKCLSDSSSTDLSDSDKVDRWESMLENLGELPTVELELWALACCYRSLLEMKLDELANVVLLRYEELWTRLSISKPRDPLGLLTPA